MVTSVPARRLLLTSPEIHARARRLRLLLTDCDGVLTDGSVYYGPSGEALRRFSVRDGMGVERLRALGIATAIVSGEASDTIKRRAEKLALPHVFLGVRDKVSILPGLLRATGASLAELAYIGDDCNDLGILEQIGDHGLTASPADAQEEVSRAAHYCCQKRGGDGAFREFAEWIIRHRQDHDSHSRRGL